MANITKAFEKDVARLKKKKGIKPKSVKWYTILISGIIITIVIIGLSIASAIAVKSMISLEENNSSIDQEIGHFIGDIQRGIDTSLEKGKE